MQATCELRSRFDPNSSSTRVVDFAQDAAEQILQSNDGPTIPNVGAAVHREFPETRPQDTQPDIEKLQSPMNAAVGPRRWLRRSHFRAGIVASPVCQTRAHRVAVARPARPDIPSCSASPPL